MEQLLPSWLRPKWVDDELKAEFQYESSEYRLALSKEYERLRVKLAGVVADAPGPGRDTLMAALVDQMEDLGVQIAAIHEQQVLVHRSDLVLTRTERLATTNQILALDAERMEDYDDALLDQPVIQRQRPARRAAQTLLTALPPTPTALPSRQ